MPQEWSIEPVALTELSGNVFASILVFAAQDDLGDFHAAQADCEHTLKAFEDAWRRRCAGIAPDEPAALARFAFAALIDEMVAHSTWRHKARWEHDSLELRLFDTDRRGTEFYTKLHRQLMSPEARPAVLLIYYTCLQLGFKGQYIDDEPSRAKVIDDLRGRLAVPNEVDLGALAPPVKPPKEGSQPRFAVLPRVLQAACLVTLAALSVVYAYFQLSY